MSTKPDGGPAFGCPDVRDPNGPPIMQGHPGMTLRDYLAAKAMQAMIAKSNGQDKTGGKKGVPLIAQYAYEFADAMIFERDK